MSTASNETDVGIVATELDPHRVRQALRSVIAAVDVSLDSALAEDPETGWDTYQDLVDRFIHDYETRQPGQAEQTGRTWQSRRDESGDRSDSAPLKPRPTPLMVARSTPPTPPAPTPAHIEELPGGQVRALTVARQHADHVGMSDEELVAAVLHPQDGWLSPQDGTSLVRIHDGCAVVVAADDDTLILSAMTTERAFEKRRAAGHPHSSGGRRKPGSGSPTGRRPQDTDALLAMCTEHGFDHELTRGGHYRLTHPQHPSRTVSLSATPSDSRSILNSVTAIRSVFGIDVRQQPDPSAART